MTLKINTFPLVAFSLIASFSNIKAVEWGATAKGYIAFSSLTSTAIEQGNTLTIKNGEKLPEGATMREIDEFLAFSAISDIYQIKCDAIPHGPQVFSINTPKKVGSKMIIGFTEESEVNATGVDGNPILQKERYLFYWDDKELRASLYKSENFDKIIAAHKINHADATPFTFPQLKKLIDAGPPKNFPGTGSHLSKDIVDAVLADAKKQRGDTHDLIPDPRLSRSPNESEPPDQSVVPSTDQSTFLWKAVGIGIGLLLSGLIAWKFINTQRKPN